MGHKFFSGKLVTDDSLTIPSGAAFIQSTRISTGSITSGLRADVTVTWPTSFTDTNYTVLVTVEDTSALGLGLQAERIRSKTATQVVIQVLNASLSSLTGTIHIVGIHD